jgi:hypothetical protein
MSVVCLHVFETHILSSWTIKFREVYVQTYITTPGWDPDKTLLIKAISRLQLLSHFEGRACRTREGHDVQGKGLSCKGRACRSREGHDVQGKGMSCKGRACRAREGHDVQGKGMTCKGNCTRPNPCVISGSFYSQGISAPNQTSTAKNCFLSAVRDCLSDNLWSSSFALRHKVRKVQENRRGTMACVP